MSSDPQHRHSGFHVPMRVELSTTEFLGLAGGLRQLTTVDVVLTRSDPSGRHGPVDHPIGGRQFVAALASHDPRLADAVSELWHHMERVRTLLETRSDLTPANLPLRLGISGQLL